MIMNHEENWAMDEFGKAQTGDKRLTKRLVKLA
ncbi:transposase DNA-binding-containing protein, partial [Uliginosibacterium flavum]